MSNNEKMKMLVCDISQRPERNVKILVCRNYSLAAITHGLRVRDWVAAPGYPNN